MGRWKRARIRRGRVRRRRASDFVREHFYFSFATFCANAEVGLFGENFASVPSSCH